MIIPMTDDERRLTEEYLYLVPEMVKKLTTRCAYVSYDEQQDLLQAGNLKDDYFFTWTRTQATLCKHLQFLEEHISEKTMISIWNATLITLYLNYDITEDFQTQFQQNSDAILSLIETLETVDIPKKS